VVLNIASLASANSTTQFEAHLNSMKMVEDFVRAGKTISLPCVQEKNNVPLQGGEEEEEEEEEGAFISVSASVNNLLPENSGSRRFHNLKFRKKLSARGRPKRSLRQLYSFNRSSADRAANIQKPKVSKRPHSASDTLPREDDCNWTLPNVRFAGSQLMNTMLQYTLVAAQSLFTKIALLDMTHAPFVGNNR